MYYILQLFSHKNTKKYVVAKLFATTYFAQLSKNVLIILIFQEFEIRHDG